jgi:hypothetical protein
MHCTQQHAPCAPHHPFASHWPPGECSKIPQRDRKAACETGYKVAVVDGCLKGVQLSIAEEHVVVEQEDEEIVIEYEDAPSEGTQAENGGEEAAPAATDL